MPYNRIRKLILHSIQIQNGVSEVTHEIHKLEKRDFLSDAYFIHFIRGFGGEKD